MIRVISSNRASSALFHLYRIAGHDLLLAQPMQSLHAFALNETLEPELDYKPECDALSSHNAELVYQGRAPFEHRIQEVRCWRTGSISQIDVAGQGICQIDSSLNLVWVMNDNAFDDQLNLEVITGPAIILLMALKETFCLHASAVSTEAGNLAFIAESGTGKSTLSQHQDQFWQQLSDDITPLTKRTRFELRTDFPQLKLANSTVNQRHGENLPLNMIIRLGNKDCDQIEFRKLDATQAFLQIIRHTVATKLFDADQLRAQTLFAKQVCGEVPVVELNYPRDLKQLPRLRESIVDYLKHTELG